MSNRLFQLVSIGLLTSTIGVAVVWLPSQLQSETAANKVLTTDTGCSIKNTTCSARKDDQSIAMSVTPKEITSGIPLEFEIRLEGVVADTIHLSLEGRDMYMGISQTDLKPVADKPGYWNGISELAICTTGEMTWRARVTVQHGPTITEANFDFSAR